MLRIARGLLAAAQSPICGSSSFAMCGWAWRTT